MGELLPIGTRLPSRTLQPTSLDVTTRKGRDTPLCASGKPRKTLTSNELRHIGTLSIWRISSLHVEQAGKGGPP